MPLKREDEEGFWELVRTGLGRCGDMADVELNWPNISRTVQSNIRNFANCKQAGKRVSEDRVREVLEQDGWWPKKWAPISAVYKNLKLCMKIYRDLWKPVLKSKKCSAWEIANTQIRAIDDCMALLARKKWKMELFKIILSVQFWHIIGHMSYKWIGSKK